MGSVQSDNCEFHWEYTEQPHAKRRIKILGKAFPFFLPIVWSYAYLLDKHPEIRKLMKANGDRTQVWVGLLIGLIQVAIGVVSSCDYFTMPWKYAFNICLGSWLGTWHFLSLHEASHGLVF